MPFSVLNIGSAEHYHLASQIEGSVAQQMRGSSRGWTDRTSYIEHAIGNSVRGKLRSGWVSEACGPPAACTHYIIVDSINPDGVMANGKAGPTVDYGPWRFLINELSSKFAQGTWVLISSSDSCLFCYRMFKHWDCDFERPCAWGTQWISWRTAFRIRQLCWPWLATTSFGLPSLRRAPSGYESSRCIFEASTI